MTTHQNIERRIRRQLATEGFRLWKVRENSRYFLEYGPYVVLDNPTGMVLVSAADLDQVQTWFEG